MVDIFVFDNISVISLQGSPDHKEPPPRLSRPNLYSWVNISTWLVIGRVPTEIWNGDLPITTQKYYRLTH